jgi:hypothetical protein
MWNIKIPGFILKFLGRDKPVEKMGGTVCDQCRVLTQYKEYYRIASHDFCSLTCYYDYEKGLKKEPVFQKPLPRKKGKKKGKKK